MWTECSRTIRSWAPKSWEKSAVLPTLSSTCRRLYNNVWVTSICLLFAPWSPGHAGPMWPSEMVLTDAISIFSQQKLCHCRQEATNATRIIHDNYDQVREGERTGKAETRCSSLNGQPPPCSNSSIYPTVLMAGLPSSVSAKSVSVLPHLLISWALLPYYASIVFFSHIRTMFRSEGKHTPFKWGWGRGRLPRWR